MKNLLSLSFVIFCLVFSSTSCKDTAPKYRIGVSQCSSDDWRNKMNEEILREGIFHDNIEIEILSADDSNEKQISDLKYFAKKGCDIIIVAPNEEDALTPVIDSLYNSGLPIIVFDRSVKGENYTSFQGADNVEIGRLAARLAYSLLDGKRKVIEICGLPGSTPAQERRIGFDSLANQLGLEIIATTNGNWNAEEAGPKTDSLLKIYPEADLIYAHNDRMAIAAKQAALKLGLDNIKVIGIDAAPNIGIQAIADSIIDATFLYPTEGQNLIRTAINILEGKDVPKSVKLPTPAAVDLTNAEILLLQDKALRDETEKITWLKDKVDAYWELHLMTRALLIGAIIIVVLLCGFVFLLLRTYWSNAKHHREIEAQNQELSQQRDQLNDLYSKLQEATSSKLTFFTNVSHDLRTPLTLISGPLQQLDQADNLTTEQHALTQLAQKNMKILLRLVNQILDFRKYDNGKLTLNLVNVDMTCAIRDWMPAFENVAKQRHIKFSIDIEREVTTAIDVEKIERVIFNLLSNAFKATNENGSISVKLTADSTNLRLSITDNGKGIAPEEIKRIFERFYQADKINPNGSGIGLALTKVFVEMHGGSIDVESKVGEGSCFTVILPIRKVEGENANTATLISKTKADVTELMEIEEDLSSIGEDTPTVLVIDDNTDICVLVKNVLSSKYNVISANNGNQGIRIATKCVPDLIICDVMMPGIDGFETCKQLKSEVETSHIPVLLLTACTTDEQKVQGYEAGADGYLEKPFDSRLLMARSQALIENRNRLTANSTENQEKPKEASSPAQIKSQAIDNDFYTRFESIVLKEIGNSEISVEEIASRLGLSRVQMYRKIKAITNYAPAEQIRIIRLKEAAHMLKTTQATVSEVAYTVGFTSPGYFTRCYRDYYNETPTETQQRTSKR